MNLLEGSKMHITMPGDYTCDIVRINSDSMCYDQLYLMHEKLTGNDYWIMLYSDQLLRIFGQIVKENGLNKLRTTTYTLKNIKYIDVHYILYKLSVKLYRIPFAYVFENDKRKWDEFCEYVEKNDDEAQINKVISVFGLKQVISNYL